MTSDAHVQSIVVSNLTPKDVVILISVSGSTKDIIEVAEIAKERKTPVVVITNYPNSPICKYADYILASSGREAAYEGRNLLFDRLADVPHRCDCGHDCRKNRR